MEQTNSQIYSLVTGASKGLGKAYAMELAERGKNLVLVSLPGEGLERLASKLSSGGIHATFYETDLTRKNNVMELTHWVNQMYDLELLVNNAGMGGSANFLDVDPEDLDAIIQLNVRATTLLIHRLLPNLMRREKAYVLNIASLAALSPIAYKTVYPASKAFVHSFTLGLQQEYSGTGVSFSVVHPGPMKTNGEVSRRIDDQGLMAKVLQLEPSVVAKLSLAKMYREEKVIKLDLVHKISLLLLKLPTRFKLKILSRIFRRKTA